MPMHDDGWHAVSFAAASLCALMQHSVVNSNGFPFSDVRFRIIEYSWFLGVLLQLVSVPSALCGDADAIL